MQIGRHLDLSSNGQPLPNDSPATVANLAVAPESGHSRLARTSCQTMLRRICAALQKCRWCQLWDSVMAKVATPSAQRIPFRKNGESCEYKKTAPVLTGAKLPWFSRFARAWLAASAGWPLAHGCLGGRTKAFYGLSAPVEGATPWGGAATWAAKLFAINRTCTSLVLTRAGLVSVLSAEATSTLPRATKCIR